MTESEEVEIKKRPFNIVQVVSLATLVCVTLPSSLTISWAAVLPKLEEDTTNFTVTKEDVSWLVSIINILGIATSFFAGSLMEILGPKRLLLIAFFPLVGTWIMIAYTPYLSLLYVGRAGQAIIVCLLFTAHHPLVAELSPPEKRGLIASSAEIVAAAGLLVGYISAHFLSWQMATIVCSIPCIPIVLLMLVVPESPYWLVRKNKKDEAERSLKRLMGPGSHVTDQLNSMTTASSTNKASLKDQVNLLRKRENAYPVFLLWLIFILRELGGKSALFSYSVYIFRQAEVILDPFVCTILLGVVRLIGHAISALTMDRLGRKPYLIGSSLTCGLSIGLTGLFVMLDLPGKGWVCIVLLLLFVVAFGLGLGPIPWTYMGELIPTPVRPLGASFMILSYNAASFSMTYAYFKITEQLGLGLTLLIFSLPNFLVLIITIFWLPETRGRSLEELQNAFRKTK